MLVYLFAFSPSGLCIALQYRFLFVRRVTRAFRFLQTFGALEQWCSPTGITCKYLQFGRFEFRFEMDASQPVARPLWCNASGGRPPPPPKEKT